LLWDERYAGKLSMNTEMDASILIAALLTGVADPFNATDDEIARIRAKLEAQRPLLRFYWSDRPNWSRPSPPARWWPRSPGRRFAAT